MGCDRVGISFESLWSAKRGEGLDSSTTYKF